MAEGEQLSFGFAAPRPGEAMRLLRWEKLLHPKDEPIVEFKLNELAGLGVNAERAARAFASGRLEADELSECVDGKMTAGQRKAIGELAAFVKSGAQRHFERIAQNDSAVEKVAGEVLGQAQAAKILAVFRSAIRPKAGLVLLRMGITPRMAANEPGTSMRRVTESREELLGALAKFARHDEPPGFRRDVMLRNLKQLEM